MLNLEELSKDIDIALAEETEESLTKFLNSVRDREEDAKGLEHFIHYGRTGTHFTPEGYRTLSKDEIQGSPEQAKVVNELLEGMIRENPYKPEELNNKNYNGPYPSEEEFDKGNGVEYESPYCKICGACGHEGCCSPMRCEQHKDGEYCKGYLNDLYYTYDLFYELMNKIEFTPEQEEQYKNISEKIFDKWYK